MSNISIHLTNLTAKDAQFITGVIALFTDPRNDEQSDLVRSGQQLLQYTPTGRCLLVDPDADHPTRQTRHTSPLSTHKTLNSQL